MNLCRLESLIGEENIEKIKKLNVLIIGLGGVGGYVIESLIRCGVGNITLVDSDTIKPSNINRQIIATSRNNNKYKTREWKKRIKLINKDANVSIINTHITEDNIECLFTYKYHLFLNIFWDKWIFVIQQISIPLLPSYKDGGNTIYLLASIVEHRAVAITYVH